MAVTTHLITTDRTKLHSTGVGGKPVISYHQQLVRYLISRLSLQHARLFAEPIIDSATINWFTDAPGQAVALIALPEASKAIAVRRLRTLAADIEGLAKELAASDNSHQSLIGRILGPALQYAGTEYIFLVGEQPVVACGGLKPADRQVENQQPLSSFGPALLPPIPSVALAESGLDIGASGPPVMVPAETELREPVGRQDRPLPKSSSTLRWRWDWWPWLLWIPGLGLALLVLRSCAVMAPSLELGRLTFEWPSWETSQFHGDAYYQLSPMGASALDLATRREIMLRQELAKLSLEWIEGKKACPSPAPTTSSEKRPLANYQLSGNSP